MIWRQLSICLLAASTFAQQAAFEVASIKPSTPESVRGSEGGPGSQDPTRYQYHAASLMDLIAFAYHVHSSQILGKALDKRTYDVDATVPPGVSRDDLRVMMQTLLAERFHLKQHGESRELPAFELSVARNGPKFSVSSEPGFPDLPKGKPGSAAYYFPGGRYILVNMRSQQEPVSILVEFLEKAARRPIVDKTDLDGRYDFTFAFTTELPGASSDSNEPPPVPGLFSAIQQQLGLLLTAKKLPFPVVVVDSVDQLPLAN
ncbi:MAG TPA: TIGR03435 family protein [Bryobacteraceae bacterium]|nr:TIGR03435 family protein [Bryobacteraceae bacterium]